MPIVLKGGQILQGSGTTMPNIWSNGKAVKWAFSGPSWNWSNIVLDGSVSTFQFVADPVNGNMQGDFSIGTGSATSSYPAKQSTYNYNKTVFEIDPAGGTFSFDMTARELSYWHKVAPIFWSYQYTKVDNPMTRDECRCYLTGGTDCETTKRYEISYTPTDTRQIYTITYNVIKTTDDTTSTTYKVNKSNATDLSFNFTIGPNNTPEASYTEIWNVGFLNEKTGINEEYFSTKYCSTKNRNTPWHGATIVSDDTRKVDQSSTEKSEICLLKLWQRPNILYYVHMKFINPAYTNYDVAPTSYVLESYAAAWNAKENDILVYIEFGISPDGGKTIWWNGVESDESIGGEVGKRIVNIGVNSIVPTDINKYITITQYDYSLQPNSARDGYSTTSRYSMVNTDATVHGTKAFKFVRFKIRTTGENNEYYNMPSDVVQRYELINYDYIQTSTTATHSDDQSIDASTNKRNSSYYAKYNKNSEGAIKFNVGRKHKTNDWKTTIGLDLFYKHGSMKYIGSTSN